MKIGLQASTRPLASRWAPEARTPRLDQFCPQPPTDTAVWQIRPGMMRPAVEPLEATAPSARLPLRMRDETTRRLSYTAWRSDLKNSLEHKGIELWGMRHGQSAMNASAVPLTSGQIETPLTDKGVAQAREGARKLFEELGGERWLQDVATHQESMPALYASPLSRARQTAQIFVDYVAEKSHALGLVVQLPIQVDARIQEMNFGRYEGHPDSESLTEHPTLWGDAEYSQRCPGGESRIDVMERLQSFLESVRERHANQKVLMFSHMMSVALTQAILGDAPVDDTGNLFVRRSDFPNAVPHRLTHATRIDFLTSPGKG